MPKCSLSDGCKKDVPSGHVIISFADEQRWVVPAGIVHLLEYHSWQPPDDFIHDVMHRGYVGSEHVACVPNSLRAKKTGHESSDSPQIPTSFKEKLIAMIP